MHDNNYIHSMYMFQVDTREQALRCGMDAFLTKPFSLDAIMKVSQNYDLLVYSWHLYLILLYMVYAYYCPLYDNIILHGLLQILCMNYTHIAYYIIPYTYILYYIVYTGGPREHSRAGERITGCGKRRIRYIKGQIYDLSFLYMIYKFTWYLHDGYYMLWVVI